MDQNKLSTKSNTLKLSVVTTILLTSLSLIISSQSAKAAGGTNDTSNSVGGLTPTTGTSVAPQTTYNPSQNAFSYSQQFSGYGTTNGCGTQFSIGTNYGNSNSPYTTTIDNTTTVNSTNTRGYSIGANLIFNSQPCTDPNKTIQLQKEQITAQVTIACNQERGKLAALILTQNPKATPKEIVDKLDMVCK